MSNIGSTRFCASAILQKFGLAPFRVILPSEEFEAVAHQTGCAPKRNRPLIPEVVAWLMIHVALHTESMTQGLTRAWGLVRTACPWLLGVCVTEEAFCQARGQLPLVFWRRLWDGLRSRYQQRFDASMRWKGVFRVLAVDGCDVNLPNVPALVRFFTRPKNGKGESPTPQGRLVALCSVFTGFCLAFKFTSLRFTEHVALQHLIPRLQTHDLVLQDRGFFPLRRDLEDPIARRSFPDAGLEPSRRFRPTH